MATVKKEDLGFGIWRKEIEEDWTRWLTEEEKLWLEMMAQGEHKEDTWLHAALHSLAASHQLFKALRIEFDAMTEQAEKAVEMGRQVTAERDASRALVAELKSYVQHRPTPAGACRTNFCYCGADKAFTLTESDMKEKMG